jgi:hypothetical protein
MRGSPEHCDRRVQDMKFCFRRELKCELKGVPGTFGEIYGHQHTPVWALCLLHDEHGAITFPCNFFGGRANEQILQEISPWAPTTIRAAACARARRMISTNGSPVTTRVTAPEGWGANLSIC